MMLIMSITEHLRCSYPDGLKRHKIQQHEPELLPSLSQSKDKLHYIAPTLPLPLYVPNPLGIHIRKHS
jgi:hypothetical protein